MNRRTGGKCPLCEGLLTVEYGSPYAQCSLNDQHGWGLNQAARAVIADLMEEMAWLR